MTSNTRRVHLLACFHQDFLHSKGIFTYTVNSIKSTQTWFESESYFRNGLLNTGGGRLELHMIERQIQPPASGITIRCITSEVFPFKYHSTIVVNVLLILFTLLPCIIRKEIYTHGTWSTEVVVSRDSYPSAS